MSVSLLKKFFCTALRLLGLYDKYTVSHYYHVNTQDYDNINRIWAWCQYMGRDIPMYRTRISAGYIGWVVECPDAPIQSMFLLNFSSWVTEIREPR